MDKAERMVEILKPEIVIKCAEQRRKKRERRAVHLFVALGIFLLIVPALLVYMGMAVLILFIPAAAAAVILLIFAPLLINGGLLHE